MAVAAPAAVAAPPVAPVQPIISKNYWYYSNGFFELESIQREGGTIERLQRNITGPMPFDDICRIVRDAVPINPAAPNWEVLVVNRLGAQHFHTQNIQGVGRVGREVGQTVKSYLESFLTVKTAVKAATVGGAIIVIVIAPGLVAKHAPQAAANIGFPAFEGGLLRYSAAEWGVISKGLAATWLGTGVVLAAGAGLYEVLNRTIGPKGFRAWQTAKMDEFYNEENRTMPRRFADDPVLSANECPISTFPIRVPFRSIHGHVYEEAAIKAWIRQQMENGIAPTCPMSRAPLTFADINLDVALSDRIELRLVLLGSQ